MTGALLDRDGPRPVLQRIDGKDGEVLLAFHCPGCGYGHCFRVVQGTSRPDADTWSWNGSKVTPTFNPSLLVNQAHPESRCHLFCRDGKLRFLNDCHHDLKGQTVDMEPED